MDAILTKTKKEFHYRELDPRSITIEDIAHALSMLCRYNGHCATFYSVAEHSVHVAEWIYAFTGDKAQALDALMHDAAEAYMGDVPAPLKKLLPDFCQLEERVERVISQKFGLTYPWSDLIKQVDAAIVHDEMIQLFEIPEQRDVEIKLTFDPPKVARIRFLEAFNQFGGE